MANTLFGMMNSATTGLMSSQVGMNVTSNNIQNIHTVGYTRQRAIIGNNRPIYYRGTGYLGVGVSLKDVQRMRDSHLDVQIRNENSKLNEYLSKHEMMQEIEAIFTEPNDVGLNQTLTDFWNAWGELSKHPDNSTMHTLVKENSKVLAEQLKEFGIQLDGIMNESQIRQDDQVKIAADIISQINELNVSLEKAYRNDPTKTPNELLDERDYLTKELSSLMGIEVKENDNYTIEVSVKMADGSTQDALAMGVDEIDAIAGDLSTGSIKGYYDVREVTATKYKNQLSDFTKSFADMINGNQGFDFFQYDPSDPLGTIEINPGLMDKTLSINTGGAGAGDNSVIIELLKLRDEEVAIGGQTTTLDQFYKNLVADVGVETKHAETSVKNQQTLTTYLDNKFESVSGINLDTEVVNLVQYQKAYEANAKVISTITEMLDTIINGLGA